MKRVLVRSNEECDWVLADRDLLMKDSTPDIVNRLNRIDTAGLQLMVKIEDPEFVRKNIRVYSVAHRLMTFRISIPYYLYRRNAH